MSTAPQQDIKAISRRSTEEIWNQGNLASVDELMDTDYVHHDPSVPQPVKGVEAFKQFVTMYRSAFPDLHFTVEDEIAEGDKVVTRWSSRGTHQGDLQGIAATGKQTNSSGIIISRVSGGKFVESWSYWDNLGLLRQLGAVAG